MKKMICLALLAPLCLAGCDKGPKCDSVEVEKNLKAFIQDNFITPRFMGLYEIDEFYLTQVTQRPSKVSKNTSVCTGYVSFTMEYLPGGGIVDGGKDITYTVQKTLDGYSKVDLYQVGPVKVKDLND